MLSSNANGENLKSNAFRRTIVANRMKVRCREDWIGKLAILVISPESYVHISSEMPVEMVNEWGMEGIFVSANKPYLTVEKSFKNSGILEKITFVDCASRLAGENPSGERVVLINNPADLAQLTESITKSIEKLGDKKFLVFDSLTTLIIYSEFSQLTQFAHRLGLIMKTKEVTSFFLAVDQEATKEMLRFLSTIADNYTHLQINKEGEVTAVSDLTSMQSIYEAPMPIFNVPEQTSSATKSEENLKPYDIFLCYKKNSGKDFADHLKAGLEEFGLHTFLDSKDISEIVDGLEEWAKIRDKALDESKIFILIMTPGFDLSPEVRKELSLARKSGNKRFIYFRYRKMSRKIVIHLENELLDIGKQEQVSFESKEEILRLATNILFKNKV